MYSYKLLYFISCYFSSIVRYKQGLEIKWQGDAALKTTYIQHGMEWNGKIVLHNYQKIQVTNKEWAEISKQNENNKKYAAVFE